jgi:hypothetical protein
MRRPLIILGFFSLLVLTGCPPQSPTLPPATSGGGWILETGFVAYGTNFVIPAPLTTVSGSWLSEPSGATGDPSSFQVSTNADAIVALNDARAPATWTLTWVRSFSFPACAGQSTAQVTLHSIELFYCLATGGAVGELPPFSFWPDPINPANLPASIMIQGSGFTSTYGMPVLQYFDMSGNLIDQRAVDSVSADGTTLTATPPNFSELATGTYAGVINNIAADGSYQYAGTVAVNVPLPFYRPTTYSDMAATDPNDGWGATSTPAGPTSGVYSSSVYTAAVNAMDQFDYDQGGVLSDITSLQGQCTWSGFPSHTDANNLTLYIPYSTSTDGPAGNGAYYTIVVTIGGSSTTLYSAFATNSSGLLTATVPAGTDISSIQVTASVSPANYNPGNPQTIFESLALDIYVQ